MNRVVQIQRDHYRVEDEQAKPLWETNDHRDDPQLRQWVHGWVFQMDGTWVAMENPSGAIHQHDTLDAALGHFGTYELDTSSRIWCEVEIVWSRVKEVIRHPPFPRPDLSSDAVARRKAAVQKRLVEQGQEQPRRSVTAFQVSMWALSALGKQEADLVGDIKVRLGFQDPPQESEIRLPTAELLGFDESRIRVDESPTS